MQRALFLLILMCQCSFFTCHLYEYHYNETRVSWEDAQQYCRKHFTDLITLTNMADIERLDKHRGWIGLHKLQQEERRWHWSLPGLQFNKSETNWAGNEPNNINDDEDCARIAHQHDFKWQDVTCKENYTFACYIENNNSFRFIEHKMNWIKAQNYCRENYTDLVSGLSQVNAFMNNNRYNMTYDYLWIGLFSNSWEWSDGSNFAFRHWHLKEEGDCAVILENGKWSSDSCNSKNSFYCYENKVILIKQNKTWEEALYYCREHHDDLVSITNGDEQRWVQETAKNASSPYIWLGLRYTCTLEFWFWVSDKDFDYTNWVSPVTTDECNLSAAMETGGGYQWYKKNDNEEFNFICYK